MVEVKNPLRTLGHAKWQIVDQVVSSATNMVLTFALASQVSDVEFGTFATTFAAWTFFLGSSRVIGGDLLLLRSAENDFDLGTYAGRLLPFSAGYGFIGLVMCTVAALAIGGSALSVLVALGVGLPALLVQDALRYIFFAADRAREAAVMDAIWFVVQAALMVVVMTTDTTPKSWMFVAAWAGGATCSLAVAYLTARLGSTVALALAAPKRWIDGDVRRALSFLIDFLLGGGVAQLGLVGVAAIIGFEAVGSLRGAIALFAPSLTLVSGFRIFILPRLRSQFLENAATARRTAYGVAAMFVGLNVAWGVLLWAVSPTLGPKVLGDTWPGARSVLFVVALSQIVWASGFAFADLARASVRPRSLVSGRVVIAGTSLLTMVVGAWGWDLRGAALGQLVGVTSGVAVWLVLTGRTPTQAAVDR